MAVGITTTNFLRRGNCAAQIAALLYRSSRFFLSFFLAHSSASAGAGLRSMIGFQSCASSLLSAMNSFCESGTSSPATMAATGHPGTQSVQSMHSSGSMISMFGPSRKQSTGQTSTQSVYLHFTQDSVTTYVMGVEKLLKGLKKTNILASRGVRSQPAALPGNAVLGYDGTHRRPGSPRTPFPGSPT